MTHQTNEQKVCDADSVWLWRDQFHYLQVSTKKPERHIASVEYVRPLTRAELDKMAESQDGVDVMRYVRNLRRIIENQRREISRLREKQPATLTALDVSKQP